MQTIQKYKPLRDRFNQRLLEDLSKKETRLDQAMTYILEQGGKRIRPMLLLLTALDLDVNEERAYEPALALELLHNYSLIHDDLPCMDDDDQRRGKPTLHVAYNEATAVLAGDYLLTESFGMILKSSTLTPEQKEACLKLLHYYASGDELLLGQSLDLEQVPELGTFQDLKVIYQKKTASLLCCALEMAVVLAGETKALQKSLCLVGRHLGMAFQIQNDFLGQKKDQEQGKFTIFSLCHEDQAKALKDRFVEEALGTLKQQDHSFGHLKVWIEEVFAHEV